MTCTFDTYYDVRDLCETALSNGEFIDKLTGLTEDDDTAEDFATLVLHALDEAETLSEQSAFEASAAILLQAIVSSKPDLFTVYKSGPDHCSWLVFNGSSRPVGICLEQNGFSGEAAHELNLGCQVVPAPLPKEVVTGRLAFFHLVVDDLVKPCLAPGENSFNVHWKNGSKIEFGQRFRAMLGQDPDTVRTVDGVNITQKGMVYVYSGDTGWPKDSCEPCLDRDLRDIAYNTHGKSSGKFKCSKCHAEFDVPDPCYCPKCGRRVF